MTAAAPTLAARVSRLGALIAVVTLAGACGGGSDEASGGVVLRTQGDIAVDQDEVTGCEPVWNAGQNFIGINLAW